MLSMLKRNIQKLSNAVGYELIKADYVIREDGRFGRIYNTCQDYTMTSKEKMYALYKSVEYIVNSQIPGDFVECGVWKGGSTMLIALTLLEMQETNRKIYLYDTFEGMSEPGKEDTHVSAESFNMISKWKKKQKKDFNEICFSALSEVKNNMYLTKYPADKMVFVKGKVEETIPDTIPSQIALLRLDTDWYESTKHELDYLFPVLTKNGVLILDDYGYWAGSKKAVDEYFLNRPILLNRIDNAGRIGIKIESFEENKKILDKETKKISIVIPTYNRAWCIERVIKSVLNQTYKNWELIIVDDGSTDKTRDLISQYLKDNRIQYFYQENKGVNFARNKGFDVVQGDYVMPFDSDDELKKDALKIIVKEVEELKDPKIGVLLFNCEDKNGIIIGEYPRNNEIITYFDWIKGEKMSGEKKAVIKGDLIKNLKYRFPNMSGQNEDILWLTILKRYNCLFIPKTVRIYYTDHQDRLTGTGQIIKKAKYQHDLYEIFLKEFKQDYVKYNPKKLGYIYFEKGVNEILSGSLKDGRESLIESVKYNRERKALINVVYLLSFLPHSSFVKIVILGHKFKEILK